MPSGKPGSFFEGMFRCRDHQKEQIAGTNPLKPLTDGELTCDPSLQGASEHGASPRCEHAKMGRGDDSTRKQSKCLVALEKMSCVVYQAQPPCDPKTLGVLLGQRREIDAWIRSREVTCALPQRVSVREPNRMCKPLFLNAHGASPKFWCNI